MIGTAKGDILFSVIQVLSWSVQLELGYLVLSRLVKHLHQEWVYYQTTVIPFRSAQDYLYEVQRH